MEVWFRKVAVTNREMTKERNRESFFLYIADGLIEN